MSVYLDEGCRIFDLIKDRYVDEDGMLVSRIDSLSGEIVDPNILISDFGDYIQNFFLLGKYVGREDICEWSKKHLLGAARKYQNHTGFFMTKNNSRRTFVWDNADTFEGLSTFYSLTKDGEVLQIIDRFVDGIIRYSDSRGLLPDEIISIYQSPFARCDYTGNFVEELALLSKETGHKRYSSLALKLLNPWVKNAHFEDVGLLPNKQVRNPLLSFCCEPVFNHFFKRNPTKKSTIVKSNSNMMSGVLQLYLLDDTAFENKNFYKSLLDHWKDGVEKHCWKNGFYQSTYDALHDKCINYLRPMPDNHHVLALYADIFHFCHDEAYLLLLERGCDIWLSHQNAKTGLFPEHPLEGVNGNDSRAIMDSNLDLSIVLLKASQICSNNTYLQSAKKCIDGIIKYMSRDLGYIEMVYVDSGKMFLHGRNYIKYMGLFIKGLLLLHCALAGADLYEQKLFLIAKDR